MKNKIIVDKKSNSKILTFLPAAFIGGAEKNAIMILDELNKYYKNINLVIGSSAGGSKEIIQKAYLILNCSRSRGCIFKILTLIYKENPNIIFLHLGFVFLAPIIRIVFPNIKIVCRLGNTPSAEISRNKIKRLIDKYLLRISINSSNIFLLQSQSMQIDIERLFSTNNLKLQILRNPIEQKFIDKLLEKNSFEIKNYIFSAATLKKQKRLDIMFASILPVLRDYPDICFVLAGVGKESLTKELLSILESPYGKRIYLLGNVENIYPLIRDSLMCISSSDYEGSSNYLLECRAMGKICAVTDCPGDNREIFEGYNKIFFAPTADVQKLSQIISLCIKNIISGELQILFDIKEIINFVKQSQDIWKNKIKEFELVLE